MKTITELVRVFGRIGLLSFGGPAAQIALMHRELVEKRDWLDEPTYLRALSFCMLLPGPEAMQLATYAGWRLRGVAGGLIAGGLFVLPGALVILCLAGLYLKFGTLPAVQAAFLGIKAAVIAIVLQALLRLATKSLTHPLAWMLALGALLSLLLLSLPFPLVIVVSGIVGAVCLPRAEAMPSGPQAPTRPWKTIVVWGSLWAAPLLLLWVAGQSFLLQLGLFFSRLAVVTFGGAYAVLAYMTQEIVQRFGWVSTDQMIDALGLAETTPGPLILVTEFVALLAGYQAGGPGLALAAALLCLWVTFIPCFLWIFLAGPYIARLSALPRLDAALKGISAAVVGVIANLSLWFAVNVLFTRVDMRGALSVPDVTSLDWSALLLIAASVLCLMRLKISLPVTLAVMALGGLLLSLV